jgi:hypothetical protein
MPKKQSSKKRTKVKALLKKETKLSARDMKNVKGGSSVRGAIKSLEGDPDQPIIVGSIRT